MTSQVFYRIQPSPIGDLLLTAVDAGLVGVHTQGENGKGSRKNYLPESAPGFGPDWDDPSEQRPKMARRWDAKTGSSSRASPKLAPEPGWIRDDDRLAIAAGQLTEYFAGKRRAFDLPLMAEGTPFQKKVWAALLEIPYGETVSYAEVARRIGQPNAVRAVGSANGRNPIAIIVPCHRVIASDGGLGGYGGGLARKSTLLGLEARVRYIGRP